MRDVHEKSLEKRLISRSGKVEICIIICIIRGVKGEHRFGKFCLGFR